MENPAHYGFIEKKVASEVISHNEKVRDDVENGEIVVKRAGQVDISD